MEIDVSSLTVDSFSHLPFGSSDGPASLRLPHPCFMHNKLTQANKLNTDSNKLIKSPKKPTQHGIHHSDVLIPFLLAIPSETLTHITSFLDPSSLFNLSATNKKLHDHISDDNTWYRAFLCQFLDIGPENDARDEKSLMLRRTESSWKKEFVLRFNLRL